MADFKVLPTVNGVALKLDDVSATDRLLGRVSASSGAIEEIPITDFFQTLLNDTDAATVRGTLGLDAIYGRLAAANAWTNTNTFTSAASGYTVDVVRNLTAASTSGAVMRVRQSHAADDQYVLEVDQQGLGGVIEALNNIGTSIFRVTNDGSIETAEIHARNILGLTIKDDGGNVALYIPDGGKRLGIGTTDVEAVGGVYGAMQVGTTGYIMYAASSGSGMWLADNVYYDGAWKRRTAAVSSMINVTGGNIEILTGDTGTINVAPTLTYQLVASAAGVAIRRTVPLTTTNMAFDASVFTNATFSVEATAVASRAEVIQTWSVSDEAADFMHISNGSIIDGRFSASLGFRNTSATVESFGIGYETLAANDTGTEPAILLSALRRTSAQAFTAMTTRPLLQVRNLSTTVLSIAADGRLEVLSGALKVAAPAASNAIASFHDADVSHPFTTGFTPAVVADEIGRFASASNDIGGLAIQAFSEADATATALYFQGHMGHTAPTAPAMRFDAYKNSSGSRVALAAGEKVLQFTNAGTALVTLLGDGRIGIGTAVPTTYQSSSYLTVEKSDAVGVYAAIINTGAGQVALDIRRTGTTPGTWILYIPAAANSLKFYGGTSASDKMTIAADGSVAIPYVWATAVSGTAVHVNSNGILTKISSSRRYKRNIKDLDQDFALGLLFNLRPVIYQEKQGFVGDKLRVYGKNEQSPEFGGLIAEEVFALGGHQFVSLDEKGRPDSVHYDRLSTVLSIVGWQSHERRIAELEREIARLKSN